MKENQPELSSLEQEALNENTPGDRLREIIKNSIELASASSIDRRLQFYDPLLKLLRLVANNPNTPPDFLEEISNGIDETARKNVAANPNTPTEVLLRLGTVYPEQVLNNPVFSLLLLENPNLVEKIHFHTLKSFLLQEKCPISFLEWAANHSHQSVVAAVAVNLNTPTNILEQLAEHDEKDVRKAVAENINTPAIVLARLTRDEVTSVRRAATQNLNKHKSALKKQQ